MKFEIYPNIFAKIINIKRTQLFCYVILTGESIRFAILMIQGHFQGQKVNFKVKFAKMTNKDMNKCNTSF